MLAMFGGRIQEKPKGLWEAYSRMQEFQLTDQEYGHFLHTTQFFSSGDDWIVYDTRNDDTRIGQTCCIEMVNTSTKKIVQLYHTEGQSEFGPGVGAATFCPAAEKVMFIHGLQSCDREHPYAFTRRTGVEVEVNQPGKIKFLDARDVIPPFTPGALRGGTHAHTWSGDGKWISFTYNDAWMKKLQDDGTGDVRDMRMVGIMAPYGPVRVEPGGPGQIDGIMYTVVITRVTEHPEPGSDQIDRAYSDGWVGRAGYQRDDGTWQRRADAFLGDTRDSNGNKLTEVFIADIPDRVTRAKKDYPVEGTVHSRPNPPAGVSQRRLTFTGARKYPGVQGPRHWLRSTADGSLIFFLMKDDGGIVQVYAVSPLGGKIRQITRNPFPVETTFSISPDGLFVAYGSRQRVCLTRIPTGETKLVTPQPVKGMSGLKSIAWSNNGKMLAYNRVVPSGDSSYYQVFILK